MTRKHFRAIADLLNKHGAEMDMIEDFANECAKQNTHFDKERFFEASGYY